MPKPLAINTDLRPDVQATLHDVADRIRDRLKLTIKNIIEIGHDLHAVKKALGNVMATNALPISLPPTV